MHRGAHPNLVKSCPVVERTSSPPHLFDMPASTRCLDLSRASENGVGGGRDPGTWLCLPLHVLSFHPSIIFPLFFFRILSPWCLLAACLSPTLTVILLYVYSLATLVYFLLRPLICLIFPPILHSTARRFSTLFVRSFSPLISLPSYHVHLSLSSFSQFQGFPLLRIQFLHSSPLPHCSSIPSPSPLLDSPFFLCRFFPLSPFSFFPRDIYFCVSFNSFVN